MDITLSGRTLAGADLPAARCGAPPQVLRGPGSLCLCSPQASLTRRRHTSGGRVGIARCGRAHPPRAKTHSSAAVRASADAMCGHQSFPTGTLRAWRGPSFGRYWFGIVGGSSVSPSCLRHARSPGSRWVAVPGLRPRKSVVCPRRGRSGAHCTTAGTYRSRLTWRGPTPTARSMKVAGHDACRLPVEA